MTVKSNIEQKVIASIKTQQLTCGECVGFSNEVIKDKKLCSNAGIVVSGKPCKQFKPNTTELITLIEEGETFQALASLLKRIPDSKLRIVGATIMREHQTRLAGFHMGQKVYVRYRGMSRSNYMSNFMSAVILYADHEMLRVSSADGKCCMTFVGKATDAIYSKSAFDALRAKMVEADRYVDPDVRRLVAKRLRCEEEYELGIIESSDPGEIPTIDRVFKENKVAKKKPNDLVAIVNAIENGFSVKDSGGSSPSSKKKKKSKSALKNKRNNNGVYSIDVSH